MNTVLHYGDGSKNELKKENKLFNFKFMYNMENGLKFCSAGFNSINDFVKFIKPINKRYYMYEYIFNKCLPYFDYEYILDEKPTNEYLLNDISLLGRYRYNVR